MKTGHNIMLQMFASQRLLIAIAASPAPLKIPLSKNNSIITALPANMIWVYDSPYATISGVPPIICRIFFAKKKPIILIRTETSNDNKIA